MTGMSVKIRLRVRMWHYISASVFKPLAQQRLKIGAFYLSRPCHGCRLQGGKYNNGLHIIMSVPFLQCKYDMRGLLVMSHGHGYIHLPCAFKFAMLLRDYGMHNYKRLTYVRVIVRRKEDRFSNYYPEAQLCKTAPNT